MISSKAQPSQGLIEHHYAKKPECISKETNTMRKSVIVGERCTFNGMDGIKPDRHYFNIKIAPEEPEIKAWASVRREPCGNYTLSIGMDWIGLFDDMDRSYIKCLCKLTSFKTRNIENFNKYREVLSGIASVDDPRPPSDSDGGRKRDLKKRKSLRKKHNKALKIKGQSVTGVLDSEYFEEHIHGHIIKEDLMKNCCKSPTFVWNESDTIAIKFNLTIALTWSTNPKILTEDFHFEERSKQITSKERLGGHIGHLHSATISTQSEVLLPPSQPETGSPLDNSQGASTQMQAGDLQALLNDFEGLLRNKRLSDVKLKVTTGEEQVFHCHKSILGARSPMLLKMIENFIHESQESILEVDDMTVETMTHFLSFIYCGKFENESWINHLAQLAYAADRYCVKSLSEFCDVNLSRILTVKNAMAVADLAERLNLTKAVPEIRTFIAKNADKITLKFEDSAAAAGL